MGGDKYSFKIEETPFQIDVHYTKENWSHIQYPNLMFGMIWFELQNPVIPWWPSFISKKVTCDDNSYKCDVVVDWTVLIEPEDDQQLFSFKKRFSRKFFHFSLCFYLLSSFYYNPFCFWQERRMTILWNANETKVKIIMLLFFFIWNTVCILKSYVGLMLDRVKWPLCNRSYICIALHPHLSS